MVRFLRIDPIVSGSKPPLLNFHLDLGESPALRNSRRMNHETWSRPEEGPGHCSISKKLLSVQMSTSDI